MIFGFIKSESMSPPHKLWTTLPRIMKNLFLMLCLFYTLTGTPALAEKAMSPLLLTPTNFAKSISKDSVKFTWQNAQNEANAKVNAYRIIISENTQFNGYTLSTDRCNMTCVVSLANSTSFTSAMRSSNKTYYWRVQGVSPTENGEWSRTGTFKTDIPVPSITNASASPSTITQGSSLTFSATLSGILPSNYSVKLNDNGNLYAMNGSGTNYSLSQAPSQIGTRSYSIGVYDASNNLKSSLFSGSYDVKKLNVAPTLSFMSGNTTATVGASYSVQLQGNDSDNNLSLITINWGDGSSNSQNASNGSTLTFSHTYSSANTYSWSANALDSANASSESLTKSVSVSNQIVVPSVTAISASPTATTQGNSVNFSAVLSSNLPSSYSVKLSYGNTSVYMSGSGTNYSVVQTPSQFGQQIFTVGIYDANNTLKSNSMTGNFEIVKANTFPTLSFMSGNSTATVGTSYSVQLQGNDSDNNLSLITINWGDGSSNSQNASNGSTLTFSHTYSSANSFTWSATAIDSANARSSAVSKTVSVSTAVVTPPVTSTSGYSKIANNGSTLSDSAQLGANPNDWACTKDNKTGLIWEVKTTDGGLRDYKNFYSWYEPDATKNGGDAGYQNYGTCKGSNCDTYAFTNAVNANSLCGKNDWRMPTVEELKGLVTTTPTVNQPLNSKLYIDATYFPNSTNNWFWSSSPYAFNSNHAWSVFFSYGYSNYNNKLNNFNVRLVRG